jgi:thymidine kinase
MAKLYFRYAAMNAGKSTALLQVAHNYEERSQTVRLFTSAIDTRYGEGRIVSRLGVSRAAGLFDNATDFTATLLAKPLPSCVLIDEAQFLTEEQVTDLHRFAHVEGVPVICYGIRSDFQGSAFAGSRALLTLADDLEEMKTVCRCGRKASFNMRVDAEGRRVTEGAQVEIGGNERYEAVCPLRFYMGVC